MSTKNRSHRLGQKLPPHGKYYLCFQIYGKTAHAAQCYKPRALNKAIGLILKIHSFEQQCVIIKGLLQSERPRQHMVTIGVDQ